ncbi:hypothetical protein LG58_4122 [Kosakonia radicincitans YD4]|nr:hypothetical protein LG58_4122 [Kosakonia radicincitans YD4]
MVMTRVAAKTCPLPGAQKVYCWVGFYMPPTTLLRGFVVVLPLVLEEWLVVNGRIQGGIAFASSPEASAETPLPP